MKRRTKIVLIVLAVLLGLLLVVGGCVAALFIFDMYDPMRLAFLVSFDVVNESGVDLRITPIGMLEGSGYYGPLPRYRDRFPPAKRWPERYEIPLKAAHTLKVTYDCDDINFRHILVRSASGEVFIVDTDKKGTRGVCYGPQKDAYTIPPLAELKEAPPELIRCTEGEYVCYSGAVEYPEPPPRPPE